MPYNPTLLYKLLSTGKRQQYKKGEIVKRTDSPQDFSMVNKGFVKRYLIANDGTLGIQSIYGPNFYFSVTGVYHKLLGQTIYEGPETYYYEAMTEVELFTVSLAELKKAAEENPLLYRDLFFVSGRRLQSFIHSLESLTLPSSYHRVAHQLVYHAREFGQQRVRGTRVTLPLTHTDIANELSIARETVSRCMMQLQRKGLIKTGKSIVVPNIDRLEEEAHYS